MTRLEAIARNIRKDTLDLIVRGKAPHIGPSFSIVEILVALYFRCLNISPGKSRNRERDRFILSKGHSCAALYAVLARKGFISRQVLRGFSADGGTLEHHPTRDLGRGIEASTGSLGHGLSIGAGMALAAKRDRMKHRIFVLLSDGETDEGSVWETALFSSHHKLDNLVAIVDCNSLQALGKTRDILNLEPFAAKWRSFGWSTREVNGHNLGQLVNAFNKVPFRAKKPSMIVARTSKGRGVSFMEDQVLWHYRCPDKTECERASREILG